MVGVAESGANAGRTGSDDRTETDAGPTETDADRTAGGTETDPERTRLGGAAVVLAAAAFVAVGGVPGVAGALAVVVGWYLTSATYAFALGQVALVALLAGAPLAEIVAVEVGLFGVLFAPAFALDRPVQSVVLAVGWVLAGGALAWASVRNVVELPVATVLLVAAIALAASVLHRYQRVSLGTVGDADE